MRRFMVLFVIVLIVALGPAGIARAVLNGQPDGDRHPFVAMAWNGRSECSASAITPLVLVTAAHCYENQGEAVQVTFDPDGFDADSVFYPGRFYHDPQFCEACDHGLVGFIVHDVGVIVLDQPVSLPEYAQLPSEGLADGLAMGTRVTIVGYGAQDRIKNLDPGEFYTRFFAPAQLVQSNDKISDQFIKVSANPSKDKGAICFGDSGGPNLLRDSTTILAVNSFVVDINCTGIAYSFRIDTPESLSFIRSFL